METNSRPEATASPVKQGQYSPRKRKDTTPKVNPQLAVELVYQELKRVEAYTKRIENAMEKGSQLEMSIEELIKTLKEESKKREEYYILKRGILLTQILLLGFLILIAIYKFWFYCLKIKHMNILNEKKEVTPIITPSLGYKLRSINWNEDFYFDNPIDKEKINSIPKAIEISKDIFLAIEKSGMQYRETYKWDEYLYFKMTAENIFAATIYYYCKHYPKEYCNLAYIIATVCNPDISILSEMLKRDRETEIFIRGLNECHTLNVGSEFTGIKNELTTYLGRLYTKEFFYLFTEGKYSPNTSQFILLHYFDNVIWQVEQLQKNGFLFLESNIKKENDEESLYDSYDDGIPIKFLINKGRLDFSKIMYESTEKNETNNIK